MDQDPFGRHLRTCHLAFPGRHGSAGGEIDRKGNRPIGKDNTILHRIGDVLALESRGAVGEEAAEIVTRHEPDVQYRCPLVFPGRKRRENLCGRRQGRQQKNAESHKSV